MPKIIGQNIGEHRERTREKLFRAVAELLAEKSYEQITLSMVAKRAEIGRTAVYNHFPDKDGLLFDFINQTTIDFARSLQKTLTQSTHPLDQLCHYVRDQLLLKESGSIVWRADLRSLVSDHNRDRFHEHALLIDEQLTAILHKAMLQELIPMRNSWMLTRLIHSAIAGVAIPATSIERIDCFTMVQDFILGGVGAPRDYVAPSFVDVAPAALGPTDTPAMSAVRCPVHHT